jgi:hypothetical protein
MIKFEKYYDGGYHEKVIHEKLLELTSDLTLDGLAIAQATGVLGLGYDDRRIKQPYVYALAQTGTIPAFNFPLRALSPAPIAAWIEDAKKIASALGHLSKATQTDEGDEITLRHLTREADLGVSEIGIELVDFGNAALKINYKCTGSSLYAVPSHEIRFRAEPTEKECARSLCTALLGAVNHFRFKDDETQSASDFDDSLRDLESKDALSYKVIADQLSTL